MNDKKQGKFLEGFFWGGVLGGGFAYLLSTKKGRDFLKELGQSGLDMLESATMPELETAEEAPPAVMEEVFEEEIAASPAAEPKHVQEKKQETSTVPRKRFFKARTKPS